MMKNKIIEESIKSLQLEGLRFSVDTLAERLKISKKTVYKYFPTKEALANAIYERYYTDLKDEINGIVQKDDPNTAEELLLRYFASAKMVRREIFNKYCLNSVIGSFALQCHLGVWDTIKPYICGEMTSDQAETYQLIIDGAFDKAMDCNRNPKIIIEMLRGIK